MPVAPAPPAPVGAPFGVPPQPPPPPPERAPAPPAPPPAEGGAGAAGPGGPPGAAGPATTAGHQARGGCCARVARVDDPARAATSPGLCAIPTVACTPTEVRNIQQAAATAAAA